MKLDRIRWRLLPAVLLVGLAASPIAASQDAVRLNAQSDASTEISPAQSINGGNAAFRAKKYDEALRLYRLGVDRTHGRAELMIGKIYLEGDGVDKDFKEARKWFLASASFGLGAGMVAVGDTYRDGNGVEKNPSEALRWYTVAAQTGDPGVMAFVAKVYEDGVLAPPNRGEAVRWYRLAASKGNTDAIAALAKLGEPPVPVALLPEPLPYPEKARKEGVTGRVMLSCKGTVAGTLRDCIVLSETPSGYGFGDYARDVATRKFRIKPAVKDGIPIDGGTVNVPVVVAPP